MKLETRSYAASSRPAPATPSPANGRADNKRERILAAALRLFAQQPYQEVTMDAVAKQASVAKGTLYLYFASKEDLYLGVISDGLEKASQSFPMDPEADVAERLRAAISVVIRFYDERRDFLRLLATEEPRLAAARNRVIEGWRQRGLNFFSSTIEQGMEGGIFRKTDSRMAAYAILGAIRSVLLYCSSRRPIAELSDDLGRIMIDGLRNGARARRAGQTHPPAATAATSSRASK
ncbi:MAG: TetR/AcrR family transcriptional regulator [Candidatus Binataceae bacterium]